MEGGKPGEALPNNKKKILSESSQSEYSEPFPSLHASNKQNSKKQKRGDRPGPGRPRTNSSTTSRKPAGRLPLSRVIERQDSSVSSSRRRGPGRPPLNGKNILRKGLDRSRKVELPATCHLCHLPVESNDELIPCRVCKKLSHKDCEEATGEDCGSF